MLTFYENFLNLRTGFTSSQNGSIGASISVVDLFKELNFALVGKRQLPASTDEAHQLILLYESGGGDLKLFADKTNRLARLSVRARAEGTQKALALEAALLKSRLAFFHPLPKPSPHKKNNFGLREHIHCLYIWQIMFSKVRFVHSLPLQLSLLYS